ncbi:hypothetical protein GYMLUDRAFT_252615 [Collybiopsis luxurians FD-317 M1]|uniref:Uncharacterized protein n=1 Tax=Collybiopsis luxurians FD-317 M1 TaxID=944289 RepID=A0A0D0B9B7_9AGAR|nr:hypothetical protein GYMLUDRAFT_252615 [Collybiopsis luxurians FD-317 M1]
MATSNALRERGRRERLKQLGPDHPTNVQIRQNQNKRRSVKEKDIHQNGSEEEKAKFREKAALKQKARRERRKLGPAPSTSDTSQTLVSQNHLHFPHSRIISVPTDSLHLPILQQLADTIHQWWLTCPLSAIDAEDCEDVATLQQWIVKEIQTQAVSFKQSHYDAALAIHGRFLQSMDLLEPILDMLVQMPRSVKDVAPFGLLDIYCLCDQFFVLLEMGAQMIDVVLTVLKAIVLVNHRDHAYVGNIGQ